MPSATTVASLASIRRLARSGEARQIREAAFVTLRELADDLQVNASTLSRWERGETSPRVSAALRWALALDVLRLILGDGVGGARGSNGGGDP